MYISTLFSLLVDNVVLVIKINLARSEFNGG
jgi:hypothetical protein